MKTVSYTESRARHAELLDGVANDREEVIMTRAGHEPVVIVSLQDHQSLRETAYLLPLPLRSEPDHARPSAGTIAIMDVGSRPGHPTVRARRRSVSD
ncbi:MAG: type II toxin-antitoxin system Phd/YefM family antitoxin [Dermatophilaceae bacterium]